MTPPECPGCGREVADPTTLKVCAVCSADERHLSTYCPACAWIHAPDADDILPDTGEEDRDRDDPAPH